MKIVVLHKFETMGADKQFFGSLALMGLGSQMVTRPATVVEFADLELANMVSGLLLRAGQEYVMLPEEAGPVAADEMEDCSIFRRVSCRVNGEFDRLFTEFDSQHPEGIPGPMVEVHVYPSSETEGMIALGDPLHLTEQQIENLDQLQKKASENVDQIIEQRAKGKRGRKAKAKAEPVEAPAQAEPVLPAMRLCENCHEPFQPKASRNHRVANYCHKDECQKAMMRASRRKSEKKLRVIGQGSGLVVRPEEQVLPEPSTEPAQAGTTLVEAAAAELAAVEAIEAETIPAELTVEEAALAQNGGAKRRGPWTIEDGVMAGRIVEEAELAMLLRERRLSPGTKVRESHHGQCRVIQFRGQHPHLAIKQLFGQGANSIVQLSTAAGG